MIRHALPWLLLALPLSALAQEGDAPETPTYDLRQRYTPRAGDRVRVDERDHTVNAYTVFQQGQQVEQQAETVGHAVTYTDEVLRVEGEQVADFRRSFASYEDLGSEEPAPDVSGLIVTYTEDEAGKASWSVPDGVEVPAALKSLLDEEAGESTEESDEERNELLAPQPVGVGESWELSPPFVAEKFGIEAGDLVPEASSARGTLTAVETVDGVTYRVIALAIELTAKAFQGMRCPEPMVFSVRVELRLSPESPYGSSIMTGTVKGQAIPPNMPPGVLVDMHTTLDRREQRRAPPPE